MLDNNQTQYLRHIVELQSQPLTLTLLKAVAGSGKTTTTLHTAIELIKNGVEPSSIMLTSFTNLASRNLVKRYNQLLQENNLKPNSKPTTGTLHTIAYQLYKKYTDRKCSVITEWQSILLMRDIVERQLHTHYQQTFTKTELTSFTTPIYQLFSKIRNNNYITDTLIERGTDLPNTIKLLSKIDSIPESINTPTELAHIIRQYQRAKTESNLIDYDDMIYLAYYALQRHIDFIPYHKYVFIDEAQDLNQIQYDFITYLSEKAHLSLVGDICQSIYGFRDAKPELFTPEYLHKKLPNHHQYEYILPINYRSTPAIIGVTNIVRSIAQDPIRAQAHKPTTPGSVKIVKTNNNITEAKDIANKVSELLLQPNIQPSDIVIISRATRYLRTHIEPALTEKGIQYQITGGNTAKKLLERPIAQFYIDCIQYYLNPKNYYAIANMLYQIKGVGKSNIPTIYEALKANSVYPRQDIVAPLLNAISESKTPTNLLDTIDSIIVSSCLSQLQDEKQRELIHTALTNYTYIIQEQSPELDNTQILESIIQDAEVFNTETDSKSIKLATIHSQKGLESKIVIATGFLALQQRFTVKDIEEANILYVQLSRAIDKLYIYYPETYKTKTGDIKNGSLNPHLKLLLTKLSK